MHEVREQTGHSPSTTLRTGLVRELGLIEALAIGLGAMIGAGIFVLSGIAGERGGQRPLLRITDLGGNRVAGFPFEARVGSESKSFSVFRESCTLACADV